MSKKKAGKREAEKGSAALPRAGFGGVILERLRRLHSLPVHPLDWQTEFVLNHFLGGRKHW